MVRHDTTKHDVCSTTPIFFSRMLTLIGPATPVRSSLTKGILTLGAATTPFEFEGMNRILTATQGLIEVERNVHSLTAIPNNKWLAVFGDMSQGQAFDAAHDVLKKPH